MTERIESINRDLEQEIVETEKELERFIKNIKEGEDK